VPHGAIWHPTGLVHVLGVPFEDQRAQEAFEVQLVRVEVTGCPGAERTDSLGRLRLQVGATGAFGEQLVDTGRLRRHTSLSTDATNAQSQRLRGSWRGRLERCCPRLLLLVQLPLVFVLIDQLITPSARSVVR